MPDRLFSTLWVLIISLAPATTIRMFFPELHIWIAFIPSFILAVLLHDPLYDWMKKHIFD